MAGQQALAIWFALLMAAAGATAYMPPTQPNTHLVGRRLQNTVLRTPRTFNDNQAAVNLMAADATEQAINAAADGDIDAGTAAEVGSITATEAAEYGQRTRFGNRHWTTGRRLLNIFLHTPRTFNNQQAAVNLMASEETEQAIDAAADGDIDAGTAAEVGSITATAAAEYGQRTRFGNRHWTTGRRMLGHSSTHINRHRDNLVDQQMSISTVSEASTEQAINAAADGDVSTSDATRVGSASAQVAAELATGRNAAGWGQGAFGNP